MFGGISTRQVLWWPGGGTVAASHWGTRVATSGLDLHVKTKKLWIRNMRNTFVHCSFRSLEVPAPPETSWGGSTRCSCSFTTRRESHSSEDFKGQKHRNEASTVMTCTDCDCHHHPIVCRILFLFHQMFIHLSPSTWVHFRACSFYLSWIGTSSTTVLLCSSVYALNSFDIGFVNFCFSSGVKLWNCSDSEHVQMFGLGLG